MEKLKPILKHKFWIIAGAVLLTTIVGWWIGTSAKAAYIETRWATLSALAVTPGTNTDDHGHGSHVTGTIAQSTNNNYGVVGVAPGAAIMPVKSIDYTGNGRDFDTIEAIYYATDHGADVVNMSLGFSGTGSPDASGAYCSEIVGMNEALEYAYGHGVTVVAAAGNSASIVSCPAAYPTVIAVGSTRYDGGVSYFSNRGDALDVTAPGGDDRVDQNGDGYTDGILQNTYCATAQALHQSGRFDQFCDVFKVGTSMAALKQAAKQRSDQYAAAHASADRRGDPIDRLRNYADDLTTRGATLKSVADAAAPLYQSLDDAQKRRLQL